MKQRGYIITSLMRQFTAGGGKEGAGQAIWRERGIKRKRRQLYCCQIHMAAHKLSTFTNEQILGLLWNTETVISYITSVYLKFCSFLQPNVTLKCPFVLLIWAYLGQILELSHLDCYLEPTYGKQCGKKKKYGNANLKFKHCTTVSHDASRDRDEEVC